MVKGRRGGGQRRQRDEEEAAAAEALRLGHAVGAGKPSHTEQQFFHNTCLLVKLLLSHSSAVPNLPIDELYDEVAIFTGSTTVMPDGSPVTRAAPRSPRGRGRGRSQGWLWPVSTAERYRAQSKYRAPSAWEF